MATTSDLRDRRSVSSAARASCASCATSAFSWTCSSSCSSAIALVASTMCASSSATSSASRASVAPVALDSFAQFLDLPSRRQDAARLDFRATSHEMRSAKHVAVDGRDRRDRLVRERHRLLEALGDVGLGNDFQNRRGMRAVDAQHVGHRHDARRAKNLVRVVSVRAWLDDDEAAASGILLPHERQAGRRLIVAFDDHVLEQIAQARLDRALVATVDLEIVRNRALLPDMAVGLHEHHPCGITEVRTAGGQFLERGEPALDRRQLLLARPQVSRCALRARCETWRAACAARPAPDAIRSRAACDCVRASAAAARSASTFSPSRRTSSCSTSSRRAVRRHARAVRRCAPSRGGRSSSRSTIGTGCCESPRRAPSSPSICDCACACSALADAITSPASSRVRSISTAASRRDSSANRAGSRRASSSWISAAISVRARRASRSAGD